MLLYYCIMHTDCIMCIAFMLQNYSVDNVALTVQAHV